MVTAVKGKVKGESYSECYSGFSGRKRVIVFVVRCAGAAVLFARVIVMC